MTSRSRRRAALLAITNVGGLAAFVWPFVVPSLVRHRSVHASDAPWILVGLLVCLGSLLFVELGRGGMGPKVVALVGVLAAAMVALRLPGFVAGFSAMFIVVLLAGNAFGPSFGFLLGAVGTFASGLFVGGLGPWLPFQMIAIGWVGAGAGLMPRGDRWSLRITALAIYGFVAAFAFGIVINLWSWPYIAGSSALGWSSSASLVANVKHYAAFYALTSAGWDVFGAVGNAVLVVVIGRPVLGALDRAARKLRVHIDLDPSPDVMTEPYSLAPARPQL